MNKIAAIQMNSTHILQENLDVAAHWIEQAAQQKAKLVVLPEVFCFFGKEPPDILSVKETLGRGPVQEFLAQQAKAHKIWLVSGTIPLASEEAHKIYSTCLVYDDQGNVKARYDKMHLFDVVVNGKDSYQESQAVTAGNQVVVVPTPVGKLGLAVCYDLRFPELFRQMLNQGAEIFALPAAFTRYTGEAHWDVLMKSRAIENLCFMVGSNQTGLHPNQRETYGHSMIIDPWGKTLACLPSEVGVVTAEIDLNYLRKIRTEFPAISHRMLKTHTSST